MVNATGGVCPVADVTQHLRITPPKAGASLLWPGGRYFGQRDSPVGTSVADLGLSEGTYFSGGAEERLAVGGAALRLRRRPHSRRGQHLLYNYRWDADLVRDDLKSYVVEHLGDADGVLVVDETGFLKKDDKSVRVQRQYSGTAGRIENCQIGVFLAYAGANGRTLLDRELYVPQVWADDRERRRESGVPEEVAFRTKGQLAQLMLERAVESEVPFGWFIEGEVYGSDRNLLQVHIAGSQSGLMSVNITGLMFLNNDTRAMARRNDPPLNSSGDTLGQGN